MTKVIITLFSIVGLSVSTLSGQSEKSNFKIENSSLIWQKIYNSDSTMNVTDLFISLGIIDNIIVKENQIIGDLKPFDSDFKGAGYTEFLTPIYVARSRIKGFITIDIKDSKYRVTVKDIRLIQKYDDGLSKQGEETSLSVFALKGNNDFKPPFLKAPILIFDYSFEKRFKPEKTDDKW